VTFIEPSKEPPRNTKASPHKDSTEKLRKALAADSLGTKKQKVTIPELWFGMIQTKRGDKWLTSNPAEANRAAAKKGSRRDQVFHNQGEAEAWLDSRDEDSEDETEIPNLIPPRRGYESDDSSVPPSDCNKSGRRKLARRQAKNQAQKARKRQSAREAVKSSGHNSEKKKSHKSSSSSSKGGRKKPKKSGRSSKKQTSHKSNDSSDPSSSSSSESDSESEDGSKDSSSTSSNESEEESEASSSDVSSIKKPRSSRHKKKSKKSKKDRKPRPETNNFHNNNNNFYLLTATGFVNRRSPYGRLCQ
jgi:hypothetical protein